MIVRDKSSSVLMEEVRGLCRAETGEDPGTFAGRIVLEEREELEKEGEGKGLEAEKEAEKGEEDE